MTFNSVIKQNSFILIKEIKKVIWEVEIKIFKDVKKVKEIIWFKVHTEEENVLIVKDYHCKDYPIYKKSKKWGDKNIKMPFSILEVVREVVVSKNWVNLVKKRFDVRYLKKVDRIRNVTLKRMKWF